MQANDQCDVGSEGAGLEKGGTGRDLQARLRCTCFCSLMTPSVMSIQDELLSPETGILVVLSEILIGHHDFPRDLVLVLGSPRPHERGPSLVSLNIGFCVPFLVHNSMPPGGKVGMKAY